MVAARETDWTGALLGGRYRLVRCLGRGGMGAVYEAKQEDLGRRVAVKVLHAHLANDQDVLTRFRREAQAAGGLGHPNIVQVTDFQARSGEPPFLVMEHLVGASLATTIREQGPLSQARVAFIAQQILSALAAAHAAGIIHRDLKPDNVFLTSIAGVDDIVKLLDFGVAKLVQGGTGPEANLTTTGAAIGTPVYMAPEQARGRGVDARTDLYSTGVCMYEALTGRLPHDPPSYSALIAAILEEPPRALREHRPEVDPKLAAIVHRVLEKDPTRRFQSADEMRVAVEPFARASVGGALLPVTASRAAPHNVAHASASASLRAETPAPAAAAATVLGSGLAPPEVSKRAPPAALPKTAEQPAVPPSSAARASDAGRSGSESRRALPAAASPPQRATPVTASRTLARPAPAARWPWVLAVAAVAGGACVGTGIVVSQLGSGPPVTAASTHVASARAPTGEPTASTPAVPPREAAKPPATGATPGDPGDGVGDLGSLEPEGAPTETGPTEVATPAVPAMVPVEPPRGRSLPPAATQPRLARPVVPAQAGRPPTLSATPPAAGAHQAASGTPPEAGATNRATRPQQSAVDAVRLSIVSIDVGDAYPSDLILRHQLRRQLYPLRRCFGLFVPRQLVRMAYTLTITLDGRADAQPANNEFRNAALDDCVHTAVRAIIVAPPPRPGPVVITVQSTPVAEGDAPPDDDSAD